MAAKQDQERKGAVKEKEKPHIGNPLRPLENWLMF
jgi:hypothetical protein